MPTASLCFFFFFDFYYVMWVNYKTRKNTKLPIYLKCTFCEGLFSYSDFEESLKLVLGNHILWGMLIFTLVVVVFSVIQMVCHFWSSQILGLARLHFTTLGNLKKKSAPTFEKLNNIWFWWFVLGSMSIPI